MHLGAYLYAHEGMNIFSQCVVLFIALFLCTIAIAVTGEPKQTMAFLPFPSLSPPNP